VQKWCRGEVVQSRCRGAECRSAEKVQSRFRSAEVHWCGGAEMQRCRSANIAMSSWTHKMYFKISCYSCRVADMVQRCRDAVVLSRC
jgi:hypothetical protein